MSDYQNMRINYVYGWNNGSLPAPDGGFIVGWSADSIGFGEMTVKGTAAAGFVCDSECMSQEFCEAVLAALAKTWKLA
jgi:hypothetical protein